MMRPNSTQEERAKRVLMLLAEDDRDDVLCWHVAEMKQQLRLVAITHHVVFALAILGVVVAGSFAFVHLVKVGRANQDFAADCREWVHARLGGGAGVQ